jgi:thiol-disulfide isomerase/thioredoxin
MITILAFVLFITYASAQEVNRTKIDEKSQMEVLIGLCNRDGLKSNLFKTYYESEYSSYTPEATTMAILKTAMATKNIKVTVVMGSWCGDSQEQVPRFFKIIDAIGYADTNVTIYCVDRTKKTDKGETDNLNITLVPTIIFYQDGKEIGRITETPKTSIEKDMLEIIS